MSVGDRLRLGIISLMAVGMRTGRNSRSHEGLQILAVAGIAGVILNPFDGPSVTGVLARSLLPLLVAGQIHCPSPFTGLFCCAFCVLPPSCGLGCPPVATFSGVTNSSPPSSFG